MASTGINYKIDKIANNERLKLLQLGDTYLISPVSLSIINYCHLTKIHILNDENDIEELWWRINYIKNFGFEMWPTDNGKQHPFEPFFDDLIVHKGLVLPDTLYTPRKQWINQTIDFFIKNNNNIAGASKLQKVTEAILTQRDALNDAYIENQTGRKSSAPPKNTPQSNNKQVTENPSQPDLKSGDIPDIIVQEHNANVLRIAMDRRSKNLPLNEEQAKLFEEYLAKNPDKLPPQKPTTNPAPPAENNQDNGQKTATKPVKTVKKTVPVAKRAKKVAKRGKK